MARIATYPVDAIPTINDKVIGTDVDNELITKNYRIGDILALVPGGGSSVQSLNTLTGELNLLGAGGISISASGTDITITGSSGSGGIQSIDGAIGPDITLAGKGGITITAVGNLINIDGSGVSGGNPGAPNLGVQYNADGNFAAGDFFTVDLKGFGNPAVNIGKDQTLKGQLNIFSGTGEGSFFGETRYYDAVGSGQYAAWAAPGQIGKQSYAVALPENEPAIGQVLVIDKPSTPTSPYTSIWSTVGGSGADDKFKYDAADAQSGYFSDKVQIGSGLSGSVSTDVSGSKTLTISAVTYSMVNSIKVDNSTTIGTFLFTGSGVTMTNGGQGQPQNVIDFNYQDNLVSGTNIKTINNQSLLGAGNITISSGGSAGGSNGQIQFNDNTAFNGDTNLNWDTTNNALVLGKETNPTFQEGIIHLKGNGSDQGGMIKFQTGAGKGSPVDIVLQAPDSGNASVIELPAAIPTSDTQVLGIKSIVGDVVTTQWETPSGGGGGTVTDVTASSPLSSTQGATPNITIPQSDVNTNGYLSSGDFGTFNSKQDALVSGTNIKSVNSNSLLGSGNVQVQETLVSATNIKTVNGNSLLGSGNLAITATATPGGSPTQVQFHSASGVLDGDTQFTYSLDSIAKSATVKIGNELAPASTYGILKLDSNGSSEGGRVQFRTGGSKAGPSQTVTVKGPDAGVDQVISLPESLPSAATQVLGLKAISGTDIRTEWVDQSTSSLPYTSYEALFSTTGGNVNVKELNNTTGLVFGWVDNTNGTLTIKASGTLPDDDEVFVLLNGFGGNKGAIVQCYFGGFNRGQKEITVNIYDEQLQNQAVDITQGNFELRIY